jgi:hypothetical protein
MEISKFSRINALRLVQLQKRYVRNLNVENMIQNIFRITKTDVDGEERPQCLLSMEILAADTTLHRLSATTYSVYLQPPSVF